MSDSLSARYQEEVLGLRPFRLSAEAAREAEAIPVVVECEELTEFTRVLLHKILGSVGLKSWAQIVPGEKVTAPVRHWLKFCEQPSGRKDGATDSAQVVWSLPALSQMLGDGPDVAERKKIAWNLLKQFIKELKPL